MELAGFVHPKDFEARKILHVYLSGPQRLSARGELVKHGRGLYVLPDVEVTEHPSFVWACKRVPYGVICLLTALSYHSLTPERLTRSGWHWIEQHGATGRTTKPADRMVSRTGYDRQALIRHSSRGLASASAFMKIVTDCSNYRNQIGIDVAVEELRDRWRPKRCTMDELSRNAQVAMSGDNALLFCSINN